MTTSCRSFSLSDVKRPADVRQRRDHRVDREGIERHQRRRACAVISRVPGRFTPSWEAELNMGARLLADWPEPCNSSGEQEGNE